LSRMGRDTMNPNPVFIMSESPEIQLKTNIVAGEETSTVRECLNENCNGWSKNLEIDVCPICQEKMTITKKLTPVVCAVNSCRNCFYLVKSENTCMKKQKKLSYHASDYSESCNSFKLERRATKKERIEKDIFKEKWSKTPVE
jgi:hypothetical protein